MTHLAPEETALQARARALADGLVRRRAAEIDRSGEYPWDVVEALTEHGFMGMTIPRAYGGQGRSLLDAVIVVEEMARACTVTARHLRVADPGHIVWDEVVAFWIVLWLAMPMGFWGQLSAFALFRFFDAAKPGPVRWADRLCKGFGPRGGWGILLDDLVAAFCTLLVLAVWRHLFG